MAILSKIFILTILVMSCVFLGIAFTQVNAADDNPKYDYNHEQLMRKLVQFEIKRLKSSIKEAQDQNLKTVNALKNTYEKQLNEVKMLETSTNEEITKRTEALKVNADIEKRVSNFVAAMKAYKLSLETFIRKNNALVFSYQDNVRQYESLATEYIRMQLEYRKLSEEHRAISDSFLMAQKESQDLLIAIQHYQEMNPDIDKLSKTFGPMVEGLVEAAAEPPSGVVVINIGKNEGVIKGMKLSVFRGSEFVATIRVNRVDPTQSICMVENDYLQKRIQKGDIVRRALILPPKNIGN